jgi:hypothetical protein
VRSLRPLLTLGVALALLPALAWAQAAGRVLLSIGEVSVQRGAQTIPLAFNAPIFTGDTVRLGANSNAQIRMSDESILGLRAGTVFRIDEYQFASGNERSVFSLLAGGVRTVTGAIGRLQRDNYAVRTPTSTIGIRGTHYTVVYCNNDCAPPARTAGAQLASAGPLSDLGPLAQAAPGAGSGPANGTYGGVTDGRINVAPLNAAQLGREFGHDEYFFQADANTAPQSLIAPPSFLHDRLAGQNRTQGQQGRETGETLAQGGINAESRPSSVPEGPKPSEFVVTEQRTQTGTPTVAASATTFDTAIFGAWTNPTNVGDHIAEGGAALVSKSALTLNASGVLTAFNIPNGCVGPNDGCENGASGSLGTPVQSGSATFPNSTQVVFWGRWASGTIVDGSHTIALSSTNQGHFMYAPLTPESVVAARTGTLHMHSTLPGLGTIPTNNFGATASSGAFPSLDINFTSRTVIASSSFVQFPNVGTGTQNWSFGTGSGSLVIANGGAYFLINGSGSCFSSGTACNGSSSATAGGQINAIFIGPAGDHVGATISAAAGNSSFSTVRVYCPTC